MQIEHTQRTCPACGSAHLEFAAVLHHMICAYVGPEYDFTPEAGGCRCPKCGHAVTSDDEAFEIVGASARCNECRCEMVVSPAPIVPASSA